MDAKTLIWSGAVAIIMVILVMVYCLIKMASHADELEDEMLREERLYDGKD